MDSVILSYGDTLLRQSDLNIIQSEQWLNDTIIGFFFEYCQTQKYSESDCIFPGPEVAQCIKLIEADQMEIILEPLNPFSRTAVFLPVNNNPDPGCPGGTHWSLLILDNRDNVFYHLDSSRGGNSGQAKALAGKISKYKGIQLNMREVGVTQQKNGFDCGIHLIVNAERVASSIRDHTSLADIKTLLDPVPDKRLELVELIKELKKLK